MKILLTIILTIIAWEWVARKTRFNFYAEKSFFTVQMFGRGLVIRDIKKHPARFSEREGYQKYIQIGKWRITKIERV